jgi:3-hydroxyacyl-CoA dehydrogenase
MHEMVKRGWLGNKTKGGFYKEVRLQDGSKEYHPLNLKTLEYEPPVKPRFPSIGKVKDIESLGERIKLLMGSDDRAGQLVKALTYQGLAYASACIPEIADTPKPVDDAMRWGFGHEAGPFETWDMLGVAETADGMRKAGFPAAAWVEGMLAAGCSSFYQYECERRIGVYNPVRGDYDTIPPNPDLLILKDEKVAGKTLSENQGASLIDLGDGILCVEFHTKMNILDDDVFNMMEQGLNRVEADYEGLVIGNNADNFSAGANLFLVVIAAQGGMWDQIGAVVNRMQ